MLAAVTPPRQRPRWVIGAAIAAALALLASVAFVLPELLRSNLNRNEMKVISRMKKISSAQSQLQATVSLDADGNGQGRYGFFRELTTAAALQPTAEFPAENQDTPSLTRDFQCVVDGRVHTYGYVFEMFLPAIGGGWVSERDPEAVRKVDVELAEVLWTCYAWPESPGWSGKRVFMINQSGDLLFSQNADARCTGDRGPQGGRSGFVSPQVGSAVAAMRADCLGETWNVMG